MIKNNGLDWAKQLADERDTDWVLGESNPSKLGKYTEKCIAEIPPVQRFAYLPEGEWQNIGQEKSDCATRGPINQLECKFSYLYNSEILSDQLKKWLEDNGYINDFNKVEFSDRFNAILSGTTAQGNSMKAPLESIRKDGLIPKKMFPQVNTFNEYYNKSKITKEMTDLGQEFLKRFTINYEKVLDKDTKEMLQRDILDLCGFAWLNPVNGVYQRTETEPNHVFLGINNYDNVRYINSDTNVFDNYQDDYDNDFIKRLAHDFKFWGQYRIIISLKNPIEVEQLETVVSLYQQIINMVQRIIAELQRKVRGWLGGNLYNNSFDDWFNNQKGR